MGVQWIPVGQQTGVLDSQWIPNPMLDSQRWNGGWTVNGWSMRVQRTVGYPMETVDHPMEIDVTLKSKLL